MNSPCHTCAFGPTGGAGAASEANNRVKGLIASFGCTPFFCHHGRDGEEYDWKHDPLGPLSLAPSNRQICGGWQAHIAELKRRGYFPNPDYIAIRKYVARRAFQLLATFTAKDVEPDEKTAAHAELRTCMKFLVAKDIGSLEIPY